MRIGLVGCVKSKLQRPAHARDLYISPLFAGRRAWVEAHCDAWLILSAKHGLVRPDDILAPYDATLNDMPVDARRAWSGTILDALAAEVGGLASHHFELHAGRAYSDFGLVAGLERAGATVAVPAAGLSLGQQLQFYARSSPMRHDPADHVGVAIGPLPEPAAASRLRVGGKYGALADAVAAGPSPLVLSFDEIDALVGGLPRSAHVHRAWWANDPTHSHARAWLSCGRSVAQVDLQTRSVTFR